jgi:hypothetical protein
VGGSSAFPEWGQHGLAGGIVSLTSGFAFSESLAFAIWAGDLLGRRVTRVPRA